MPTLIAIVFLGLQSSSTDGEKSAPSAPKKSSDRPLSVNIAGAILRRFQITLRVPIRQPAGGPGAWSSPQVMRILERLDPFREEEASAA